MDMNQWIRGRRRWPRPSEPRPDPEQAARIRDYLAASGEPIPDYLQPAPSADWGGGPRGPISHPPEVSMNTIIREIVARKKGASDA